MRALIQQMSVNIKTNHTVLFSVCYSPNDFNLPLHRVEGHFFCKVNWLVTLDNKFWKWSGNSMFTAYIIPLFLPHILFIKCTVLRWDLCLLSSSVCVCVGGGSAQRSFWPWLHLPSCETPSSFCSHKLFEKLCKEGRRKDFQSNIIMSACIISEFSAIHSYPPLKH